MCIETCVCNDTVHKPHKLNRTNSCHLFCVPYGSWGPFSLQIAVWTLTWHRNTSDFIISVEALDLAFLGDMAHMAHMGHKSPALNTPNTFPAMPFQHDPFVIACCFFQRPVLIPLETSKAREEIPLIMSAVAS